MMLFIVSHSGDASRAFHDRQFDRPQHQFGEGEGEEVGGEIRDNSHLAGLMEARLEFERVFFASVRSGVTELRRTESGDHFSSAGADP